MNGKKLFIDEGARLSTVNRDIAVRQGEEFWTIDQLNNDQDQEESTEVSQTNDFIQSEVSSDELTISEGIDAGRDEVNDEQITENIQEENPIDADRLANYTYKDIRRGHTIKFKQNESD